MTMDGKYCDKCPNEESCSILGECFKERFGIPELKEGSTPEDLVIISQYMEPNRTKLSVKELSERKQYLAKLPKSLDNPKGASGARQENRKRNYALMAGVSKFMLEHETFQLAFVELVHRYYYDKLLNTEEAKHIHNLHQHLTTSRPNWRYRIKKKLERYHGWEDTNALNIGAKPVEEVLMPDLAIYYKH